MHFERIAGQVIDLEDVRTVFALDGVSAPRLLIRVCFKNGGHSDIPFTTKTGRDKTFETLSKTLIELK